MLETVCAHSVVCVYIIREWVWVVVGKYFINQSVYQLFLYVLLTEKQSWETRKEKKPNRRTRCRVEKVEKWKLTQL